ncbi:MAG TPA: hypothetical protein VK173_10475 [Lacibacter sp.]|nr:hypothetical protein [Lacibacter sp.]
MRQQLLIIIVLIAAFKSRSQTYYRGLERMCWTTQNGNTECYDSPRKWYHLNTVLLDNDSIFLYKIPVQIQNKDTIYSASDGAFYYYLGVIKKSDTTNIAYLTSHNCDYCGTRIREDSLTGFNFPIPRLDTLNVTKGNNILTLGKTSYKTINPTKDFYFPARNLFYFDSNSISRRDPKGQYALISQGIEDFLQTKQLKLDNDTLRICIERYDFFKQNSLVETLITDSFHIDTTNIHFSFLTRKQLREKSNRENKVLRYIEVNQIIDYWKAARIELTYKIIVPKSIHKFSEREYSNSFEYYKVRRAYKLAAELPENNWNLVEKK